MKIRPKIPIYQIGGGVSGVGRTSNNWYDNVHLHQMQTILNRLKEYGEGDDYMNWLNSMLHSHSYIWNNNKDRMDRPVFDQIVLNYLRAYSGDSNYYPYVSSEAGDKDRPRWQLKDGTNDNYNLYGIKSSFDNGIFTYPGKRTSKDNPQYNYNPDGYFSGITDYRRLLGRKGDYTDELFNNFRGELNKIGYDIYEDANDNGYYKLKRLVKESPNDPPSKDIQIEKEKLVNKLRANETGDPEEKPSFWNRLSAGFNKIAPDLLEGIRLAGTLHTNNRVYDEMRKAIIPNLLLSYNTYRQVVGDEATKQAYYRRAVQGETKAALPFTSDADRLMAYMMEAKRIGDELRAQGDLADNLEIRRTSDESNQHLWANTQRATEVANANITELNKAAAAKHLLNAQKKLADWTNIDLFLLGKVGEYKLKKAEEKLLARQLSALDMLEDLLGNTTLLNLRAQRDKAYDDYIESSNKSKEGYNLARELLLKNAFNEANRKYQQAYILWQRDNINKYRLAKSGTKLTYKDNTGKLLYKISKDIADHFRRISKMTDDSRVKTLPKPIKLSSHPRKMLMGGIAPFYIYRPYGVGSESSLSVQQDAASSRASSSSSSKDNAGKDKLDMVKELFKAIQGQGLPVDVNSVYLDITSVLNKAKAFGEELSTDDIASMYLNSMLKINNLKYSKDVFDKAKAQATANEALNEFAVTTGGKLVLQDMETGKIKSGTYQEFVESNGKLNPLTNDLLLNLRAYSPNMALWKGDEMMQIVNNGVGMNKVADLILKLASKLGSSEEKIEGISEVQAHKIKNGLLTIAGFDNTPDGFYKISKDIKDSRSNVQAALNYIMTVLPPNYKTLLDLRSGGKAKEAILSILTSQTSDYYKEDIAPLTGKAAADKDKDSSEKILSDPLMQLIQGQGGTPRTWDLVTKDSRVKMSVDGIEYSQLPKIKDDMSLDKMLSESGIGGILDSKQGITFGDLNVSPDQLKDIMYSNSGGMVVTLPCKIVNGHKEVNLGVRKVYEEAVLEVESKGLSKNSEEYYKLLGEVLKQKGLSSLLDSKGYPDRNKFGQFLVVEGYTTSKLRSLDTSSQYIEKVKNPDALLEEKMIRALSTDSKKANYNLDIDYWFWGDDVYRGTVFIPLTNNLNSAINAWGNLISIENARELENKFQNFNKASNMKSSNSDAL